MAKPELEPGSDPSGLMLSMTRPPAFSSLSSPVTGDVELAVNMQHMTPWAVALDILEALLKPEASTKHVELSAQLPKEVAHPSAPDSRRGDVVAIK